MAITVTDKEYKKIYSKTTSAFTNKVYDWYRKNKYAMDLKGENIDTKKLFIYLMALGKNEELDCLTEKEIYSIYSQINILK